MKNLITRISIISMVAILVFNSYLLDVQAAGKCNKKCISLCAGVSILLAGAGVGGYFIYKAFDDDDSSPTPAPTPGPTIGPSSNGLFNIKLVNMGSNNQYDTEFVKAKRRWESVIVNDLPDLEEGLVADWFNGFFEQANSEAVDDVIIGYEIAPIDGEGSILGQAGPIYVRPGLTSAISGIMVFDEADFAGMSNIDREIVILHEMGHVLGIGTFWSEKCGAGCQTGDYSYTCLKANEKYGQQGFVGTSLSLENDGGSGTRCGHWDEASFVSGSYSELMTGFFESNKFQPLSEVTAAALEDLGGYEVNYGATDSFNNLQASGGSGVLKPTHSFDLRNKILDTNLIELD